MASILETCAGAPPRDFAAGDVLLSAGDTTGRLYSDGAARGFYARWRDLMNTPAWHEKDTP